MTLTVVKVGGSLYDLPDLGPRLRAWLTTLAGRVLIVPGGGAMADVIRALDRTHGLGEETAHRLALRSLTLNAWFLAALLDAPVIEPQAEPWEGIALLDVARCCASDPEPAALPACWEATSDSVAARAAIRLGAANLVLLKSVDVPEAMSWEEAARAGIVDPLFPVFATKLPQVCAVNLRAWCAEQSLEP